MVERSTVNRLVAGSSPARGADDLALFFKGNFSYLLRMFESWYTKNMNKDLIKNIVPEDYKTRGSYSPAKKIDMGDFYMIFASGVQAPKDDNHRVVTDDIEEQTKLVFEDITKILALAGATLDDVVKAVIYITDMKEFDKISKIRGEYFKNSMPVSTLVEVNRMTRDGAKIEIEVTAIIEK